GRGGVGEEVGQRDRAQGGGKSDGSERLARGAKQFAVQGRRQEVSARILVDRIDALWGAVRRSDRAGGARTQAEQAPLSADPNVVFSIFEKGKHVVVRERRRR